MDKSESCRLFRQLIYHPSERTVSKQEHFMSGHEATCLDCVNWMLAEAADIQSQHDSGEHELDNVDLARLKRTKAKLARRAAHLGAKATASDLSEIEPTSEDLEDLEDEETNDTIRPPLPNPVRPEEGDTTACSA